MTEQDPIRGETDQESGNGVEPPATDAQSTAATSAAATASSRRARPRIRLTRRPQHWLVAGAVAVLIGAVTAGTLVTRPAAGPATGSPAASQRPATGTGGPIGSTDPGGLPLPAGEDHSVAILTAEDAAGPVVPLDARFRLSTADGSPATNLAGRLHVEPAVDLTTTTAADGSVILAPAAPLQAGVVYRFELAGPTGELADSWAFQAKQPLRIIETLPADEEVDVPLDTGIEVTFDQDGVGDTAAHVRIEPATPGRFETHGRTVAFVPDRPLAPKTVYTIMVSKGIEVPATHETTQVDTRFAFETAAKGAGSRPVTFDFQNDVFESRTADRAVLALWGGFEDEKTPKSVAISIFRLADLDAAIDAFRSIRTRPEWSRWSQLGLVDTARLSRVLNATVRLNAQQGAYWFSVPQTLRAGWYVVQLGGSRPAQAVLQVTNVAAYLVVSQTRTLVWVNDLATKGPIAGATVAAEGTTIATTNREGLADGATPTGILNVEGSRCDRPCDPVVTVQTTDGRRVFLPVASTHDHLEWTGYFYEWSNADTVYWSLLNTDRTLYRSTDTIHVWGMARARGDGSVPSMVSLRLTPTPEEGGPGQPPVATVTSTPRPTGAFVASIPLVGLPAGNYVVEAVVGDSAVRVVGVAIGPIAKPAYRIDITTGHGVYVAGDRIKVTANVSFFEGTPVPGLKLRFNGDVERTVTTNAVGSAVTALTAGVDRDQDEGPSYKSVGASPAREEEGEIAGVARDYVVFPSTRILNATGSVVRGDVDVRGTVHTLARDRLEREITSGQPIWELDPRGTAVAGASVTARFIEIIPVRRREGTEYDFIAKKVVPVIRIDLLERAAGTVRVRSAADGTFRVVLPHAVRGHDYRVVLSVGDADGHVERLSTYASADTAPINEEQGASLVPTNPAVDHEAYGVGEQVDLTMADPKARSGDGSRYLFFIAQEGIRSATVQASSRFRGVFEAWAPPGLDIGAVRWNGRGFVGAIHYSAPFQVSDRHLGIELTPNAARYAPGDTVTVGVRTTDAKGAPTPATVVLRAVDEKLFSIGAAIEDDPLLDLYGPLAPGLLGTYASHHLPLASFEGGDTGGGGDDRFDFRDSLLFEAISTGADGRGTVSFPLSDDLTSWRVGASGVTLGLEAGSNSVLVPVGLPFFVDASIAPEYLLADRPILAVRAFGSSLAANAPVTIEVSAPGLGFNSGPLRGMAFSTISVPLPALKLGVQTVSISASSGSGSTQTTDRLTRSFRVVETRLTRAVQSLTELSEGGVSTLPPGTIRGGSGFTTVVISDTGAGRHLSLLQSLAEDDGARFEQGFAATLARAILVERFGLDASTVEPSSFAAERYQGEDGGLAILPYASSNLGVSAFAAMVGPNRVNRVQLASYLRAIDANADETRERRLIAVAGLAALGDPVLPEIQRLAVDPNLTVRERLLVGIGAAAAGDQATARSLAEALIAAGGEQVGATSRLRAGSDASSTTSATALMAVLEAMIGDSRAPRFWAYVEDNPVRDQLQSLPAIAFVSASLRHSARQAASFAWTVDGTRQVVDLDGTGAYQLDLIPAQLKTLTIERVSGSVDVLATWRDRASPADFQSDPDFTMVRTVRPSTSVARSDLVIVDLKVTFGPQAAAGCRDVVEQVPSGLTPVGPSAAWIDRDDETSAVPAGTISPYDQSASQVRFCAYRTSSSRTATLRYLARVITAGTYAWEPAVAESGSQAGLAALTPTGTIRIR